MSRFCPLFSSSKGNCTYIGCSNAGILVDAGASAKAILEAMVSADINKDDIKAILITHSHTDHISSLKRLGSLLCVPLIMSQDTAKDLADSDKLPADAHIIDADAEQINIEGMTIKSFCTSHDCAGSRGYTIVMPDGVKIAVCTDLGFVSDEVREAICGSQLVMLESNHDISMLQKGPYPPELKNRILGDCGHLSNIACAAELPNLIKNGTTRIVLAHVSQDNNLPTVARTCALAALTECGYVENRDFILYIAPVKNGKMLTL
ncbi:MAG: MBL fold metallo-hydrolase [Clostridia bacterium]|nr:MBL fold metallo-hydrolase [Clostridia bacterium]